MATEAKLSGAELTKAGSNYLRGTVGEELGNDLTYFSKSAIAVLKFHGVYQQDDRDIRKERRDREYSCMVRVGIPGGILTRQQYLELDRLADHIGDGSLRITTRQGIQYHYVGKKDLWSLMHAINESGLGTFAACGDVVRNVVSCSAPIVDPQRVDVYPYVRLLARELKPKTQAYVELWVDGEKAASLEPVETEEPLYGDRYLPRKFKIGFAYPGDNTSDIYANDVGIVPHFEGGGLLGFTILAGGGMGQSNGVKGSFPRVSDPICFVQPDDLLEVVKVIVTIHRDFGNRENRKLARLKYVLADWGVPRFRAEVEARMGKTLSDPKPLHWHRADDYLGWHKQVDDLWFLGLRVVAGRIKDTAELPLRAALREVLQAVPCGVRFTVQQNLYLSEVPAARKAEVEAILARHGVRLPAEFPPILRHSMACPALPTCGLAITESERILPDVSAMIQAELDELELGEEAVHVRTTGCPNGCARPYTAEVGIVGQSVEMYSLYLAGSPLSTRLAQLYTHNVKIHQIGATLRPLLEDFRAERQPGEAFGDYCYRVGLDTLRHRHLAVAAD
ncbi:MAG: NADPH-dependent assimilatory sulfite reductase hemoprotein subunit [Bryobacterales bacterium]|jgi:sulfite reductase (ferredoxin)|nr:NADPH-dependent assimilatory sulfite reductase hemoprotein subunit [Bryobacterales bacterium]